MSTHFVKKQPLSGSILKRCRSLRKNATGAESFLWNILRNRGLEGYKFRRQHPFGEYILDFYCQEIRLAIELDGCGHLEPDQKQKDDWRSRVLGDAGIKVLRFWNHEVMNQTENVLNVIWDELQSLAPTPSPKGRGEEEQ